MKYNYLTVIDEKMVQRTNKARKYYLVRCDCGNEKWILAQNVKNGRSKSCGCKESELKRTASTKHGLHKARIYQTYHDMKDRCLNPKNPRFHRYGGRGITICADWLESFENFYLWAMTNGYTDKLTIERVDNNGEYCPENCKWATMEDQLKNREFGRRNKNAG